MVREKELTLTCYEWLIVVAWLNQKRNRFITAQYNIFLFFPPSIQNNGVFSQEKRITSLSTNRKESETKYKNVN